MWKLILSGHKKSPKNKGFITLEVIVALLIAAGFVAVSMQALVYAMAIKVQAQEKQRANQLIQEDIERINQLGSDTTLAGNCNPINYADGYANNLWTELQAEAPATQSATSVTKTLLDGNGKTLGLRRFQIINNPPTAPYRTLKVGYQVWTWDGTNFKDKNEGNIDASDNPIAETYVEIIPDVALACP